MRIEPRRRYRLPPLPAPVAGVLRESPAFVPCLLATVAFLALAAADAGALAIDWYAAALFVLALCVVTVIALGVPRAVPTATVAALGLLAAFAAWAYLSITWAGQQGDAWDGANRTALYLLVFALFAVWPTSETGGRIVIGLLGAGIAGIGLVELLRAQGAADPTAFFVDARFFEPAGYVNANVALWTLGMLACLFSAASRESGVVLRPLFLGGAGLLAALALMGQSRGWALALPIALLVFVALTPGRVRLVSAVALVALGVLVVHGPLVAVYDDEGMGSLARRADDASLAALLLAAGLALAGLAWAAIDMRVRLSGRVERDLGRGVAAVAALSAVGLLVAAAVGAPEERVRDAWEELERGGGAGYDRSELWRTAWDGFRDQPARGIGIENHRVEYVERGTATEPPRSAHSLAVGVLAQTGLVGVLLLGGALVAAVVAALGVRRSTRGRRAVAGAALGIAAYWLLHASVDRFWELPGLTAPVFALLGLAGAMAARPAAARPVRRPTFGAGLAVGAAAVVLGLSFLLPWLAALQVDRAVDGFADDAAAAFDRLDSAERLNRLSTEAQLTAASIALSVGDTARARTELAEALERDPDTAYALLQLGLLAASEGQREEALRLLRRVRALAPRDAIARQTYRAVRRGDRVPRQRVDRRLERRAREADDR